MTELVTTPVSDKIWDAFEALSDPDGFIPANRLAYLGINVPESRPSGSIYYSPTSSRKILRSAEPVLVQPVRVSVSLVRERFTELLDGERADGLSAACLDLYPGGVFILSGTPRVVASRLLGLDIPTRIWSHASISRRSVA
ncbi:hypothetical protein [Aeromicrobium sp. 179-A 4D2 NHS]|uniref:hypothetical protein n=1 Tax=Aeromicrobium sp. 179-A 4D2 NHS TaxID=3142375 RepID=UPI0039A1F1D6